MNGKGEKLEAVSLRHRYRSKSSGGDAIRKNRKIVLKATSHSYRGATNGQGGGEMLPSPANEKTWRSGYVVVQMLILLLSVGRHQLREVESAEWRVVESRIRQRRKRGGAGRKGCPQVKVKN